MSAHTHAKRTPSSLPVHLTRLVGREREIAAVVALLGATRLVTLTGAGGSGKTRIALEAARVEETREVREVAWVDLAPVLNALTLGNHVAAALGVRDEASRPIEDTLVSALGDRSLLLVLDNCEHIVDACAALVDTLLRRCPRVSVLATSREALGIGGERSWLVPVLSLPGEGDGARATAESMAHSEAVQLFVHRARDVQPAFALTDSNASAIGAICRRLDGLPLAIELAAARVRVLAPEQIADRLHDAFHVLGGRPRASLPRHRTLREAVDWSYRLLGDVESRLLARLSVFAGDFSLDEAEAVCADRAIPPEQVLDALSALVDKSLAAMRESSGEARYYLLETIRQFGAERLAEAEETHVWRARHAREYAARAAIAEPDFITPARASAVARLSLDLDNIRAALSYTREHDRALHLRLAGMLTWFWYSLGLWTEGRRWLEGAIAIADPTLRTRERAAVLFGIGALASLQADLEVARRTLDECLDISREIGDEALTAYASNYLCMAYSGHGLLNGEPYARSALAWFEQHGDLYGQRLAHLLLATNALGLKDMAAAERSAAAAVSVARKFGVDRELGIALQVYGTILLHHGDLDGAKRDMIESLQRFRRDPQPLFMARAVDMLAIVNCRQGDVATGVRRFGAAAAERELIGAALFVLDRERLAPYLDAARASIGEAAFAEAMERGRRQRLADVIDEAINEAIATTNNAEIPPAESVDTSPIVHDRSTDSQPGSTDASEWNGLRVQSLPRLRISRDGRVIAPDAWRSSKPRELLVYLLMHPEGRTREQVGHAFWPDGSAAAVKNNFHVTMHHLRKAVGAPECVRFEGGRYLIAGVNVEFDATDFENRVTLLTRRARAERRVGSVSAATLVELQHALEMYQGDFLADEAAGDWHLEYRDALRRLFTDAVSLAGELYSASGDHESAADMYRRLVNADPTDEAACRSLMEALARAGARSEAIRQFDRFVARLESEFDDAPSDETVDLRDRIARGELAHS